METLDDKYRIEQLLGQGGMGAVYRATHLGTKRTVAVKVIHPQLSTHDQFVARFRREAEAGGRLRHPNVVDVTDFGFAQTTNGPVAYLVMEYLDGCTLAEIVGEEGALRFSGSSHEESNLANPENPVILSRSTSALSQPTG